jgi:excisionase family DNA binding protein
LDDYLSVRGAAELIGVRPQTMWTAVREGRIEYLSIGGKKVIHKDAAAAYKSRTQQNGVKPAGRPRKGGDNG